MWWLPTIKTAYIETRQFSGKQDSTETNFSIVVTQPLGFQPQSTARHEGTSISKGLQEPDTESSDNVPKHNPQLHPNQLKGKNSLKILPHRRFTSREKGTAQRRPFLPLQGIGAFPSCPRIWGREKEMKPYLPKDFNAAFYRTPISLCSFLPPCRAMPLGEIAPLPT